MKELVTQILNGREKIEDVYFVACGGSLVDLYPGQCLASLAEPVAAVALCRVP